MIQESLKDGLKMIIMKNNLNFTSNLDKVYFDNSSFNNSDWQFISLFDEMKANNMVLFCKAKTIFNNQLSDNTPFSLISNY